MLSRNASHYLIPPPGYFWRWDVEEHAVVWSDGTTMAFARELVPLLKEIAGDIGLPPLGSMLLVLCLAKQPEVTLEKWHLLDQFARSLGVDGVAPSTVVRLQLPVQRGLAMLARLPEDLLKGQSARLHLLRTLFEPTFNRLPADKSLEIVDEFRAATAAQLEGEHDLGGMTRLLRDLKALDAAFKPWTLETLTSALRTGLKKSSLDDASSDDVPDIQETGDLWSDLEQSREDEMRAVASLAKQLLAVIQIPRPLHRSDDQPVGGVSDIANKGDPARLLLSELAHDADTLAVRLAFNEALYLRRETPPATPLPQRHVLLDNSILLWGRARIFATAVALALLKPRTPGEVVTLHGHRAEEFETMKLASTTDLRVWWSRLDASPNCGVALHGTLTQLLADKAEAQPEIVLVTHADAASVLAPSLSRRVWPPGLRFFIITVNSHGRCVLQQRNQAGARELATVKLELPAALSPS